MTPDIVPLAVHTYGRTDLGADADAPPVVVLHGLFGSGRNWTTVGRRLGDEHQLIGPDLRNHGMSPWSDTMTYDAMAADVVAVLEQHRTPVALVGHSMGGKAAMLVALTRPDLVDRLVIVDVAPVTYESVFDTYARAMRSADLSAVTKRSEVDVQLAGVVPDAGTRAFLLQNLVIEPGGARWRVNLPVLERDMATISGFPVLAEGMRFPGPTLVVAGGKSDYVRPAHHELIRGLFPTAEIEMVPEAGHWVHAERLDDFLALLRPFLAAPGQPYR